MLESEKREEEKEVRKLSIISNNGQKKELPLDLLYELSCSSIITGLEQPRIIMIMVLYSKIYIIINDAEKVVYLGEWFNSYKRYKAVWYREGRNKEKGKSILPNWCIK